MKHIVVMMLGGIGCSRRTPLTVHILAGIVFGELEDGERCYKTKSKNSVDLRACICVPIVFLQSVP